MARRLLQLYEKENGFFKIWQPTHALGIAPLNDSRSQPIGFQGEGGLSVAIGSANGFSIPNVAPLTHEQ